VRSRPGGQVIGLRLQDGIPLVAPQVNGECTPEHDGILANRNCCTIPLTMTLKPLHDAAGLARVRVTTYQSVSVCRKTPHG
jgi:aspartate-semialdehyde dehydrogenase